MKYQAVVFDVDGTLIDSFPRYATIMQAILPKYGMATISNADLVATFPLTADQTLAYLGIDARYANAMAIDYTIEAARLNQPPVLYAGIADCFAQLAASHPDVALGIVTSGSNQDVEALKAHFAFMKQMWVVVTADTLSAHKPAPEPLLYAIDHMGVDRKATLYVGDAITDAQCAENAGVDLGLAGWGQVDAALVDRYAKYLFQTPQSILKYLK